MDDVQRELFGKGYPTRVGTPRQHWVYSENQMSDFVGWATGRRDVYSILSWYTRDMTVVCDKVSLDFDSPEKESDWGYREVTRLKNDSEFRDNVLGDVCRDAHTVAEWCEDNDQPVIGVFSGMGLHVHLLYQPKKKPGMEMDSTATMLAEDLDLETIDRVPIGDVQRLLRIPNCKRVEGGKDTGVWTIPLSCSELKEVTPTSLVKQSTEPRHGFSLPEGDRPTMTVKDAYIGNTGDYSVPEKEVELEFSEFGDEFIKQAMNDLLLLPCMTEHIVQPEPGHKVRMNAAVILYNEGFTPQEVFSLFERFNWLDWNPELTKKQLKQIYRKKYSEMSCESLMSEGLCRFADNPSACPQHGWSGGEQNY